MGLNEVLSNITDPYDRQARLFPALLAILPPVVLLALFYTTLSSALTNIVMLLAGCGGLYLLTNICRELGKGLEERLFKEWSGKPTTQLLRHRDNTIEYVTKQRYHQFLGNKINAPFPTADRENSNPKDADEVYQSGVRWLLNQTRDNKKFDLVLKENIAYGFRRNALGIKPLAIFIAFCSVLWVLALQDWGFAELPAKAIASLAFTILMLLIWLFFFTKANTRSAAFSYAEMLLRACDSL